VTSVRRDILVVGAGVSGLTTALHLARSGYAVRIRTKQRPLESTSCAAGAIWGPFLVGHEHAEVWSEDSRARFAKLSAMGQTGVRMAHGIDAARQDEEPPDWATKVPGFCRCEPVELPDGFVSGWRYTVPVVDMPVYLRYLMSRLAAAGVRIDLAPVTSLDEATGTADVTVNCTGAGARELVGDRAVEPVRGQLAVVANPGIHDFFAEHTEDVDELTYLLPMGDHVVLGGSAHARRTDAPPDLAIAEAIVERCAAIEPRLAGATVLEHRVGFRPHRPRVRVEYERYRGRHVVHNYGHGGAGVTLSWGCAREVVDLVDALSD
jgi:D-amino-acid oxidase